jgi:hypothetical protein
VQRGNSPAHGFNRYAYANNNPYKYIDPDGQMPLLLALPLVGGGSTAGSGTAIGMGVLTAVVMSIGGDSDSSQTGQDVDDFVDDLKGRSEPDSNTGKTKIRTLTDGSSVEDAFGDFPGEEGEASDGSPIKTAEDGSTAHIHDSSKDGGKKTLNIKRPTSKKPLKIREPEVKSD